jgi:hypothetical protein
MPPIADGGVHLGYQVNFGLPDPNRLYFATARIERQTSTFEIRRKRPSSMTANRDPDYDALLYFRGTPTSQSPND